MRVVVAMMTMVSMLSGCARVMVHMKITEEPGGPDYVVVKIKASRDVVFDCVSAPEGDRDPTCTKVKYK